MLFIPTHFCTMLQMCSIYIYVCMWYCLYKRTTSLTSLTSPGDHHTSSGGPNGALWDTVASRVASGSGVVVSGNHRHAVQIASVASVVRGFSQPTNAVWSHTVRLCYLCVCANSRQHSRAPISWPLAAAAAGFVENGGVVGWKYITLKMNADTTDRLV